MGKSIAKAPRNPQEYKVFLEGLDRQNRQGATRQVEPVNRSNQISGGFDVGLVLSLVVLIFLFLFFGLLIAPLI